MYAVILEYTVNSGHHARYGLSVNHLMKNGAMAKHENKSAPRAFERVLSGVVMGKGYYDLGSILLFIISSDSLIVYSTVNFFSRILTS